MKRAGVLLILAFVACDDPAPQPEATSRFAAVKREGSERAAKSFCEAVYPARGEGARRWSPPPSRALPVAAPKAAEVEGWKWINLWASWCGPCLAELPLLSRWRDALEKEGLPLAFEMWSIDEEGDALAESLDRPKRFPGNIFWLRGPDDLAPFLESLGASKNAAIPVHALVDPQGNLRCLRIGAVAEDAYGAVRSIVAGG